MSIWGNPVMLGGSGGGGGGITILSGSADPTAAQGSNGQVYLKTRPVPAVEYIESAGGPWLTTGYIPTSDSKFVMDMELQAPYNSYDTPFGARAGSVDAFVAYNGGTYRFVWGGANQNVASIADYYGQRVQMVLESGRCALEQSGTTLVEKTFSATLGTMSTPMGIFTLQTGAGADLSMCRARGKLYGFEIYESGDLVRKYVPISDPTNGPGVIDIITGQSFFNLGSGSFVAGPGSGTVSDAISGAYAKVGGAWQNLIGTDISDINLGG